MENDQNSQNQSDFDKLISKLMDALKPIIASFVKQEVDVQQMPVSPEIQENTAVEDETNAGQSVSNEENSTECKDITEKLRQQSEMLEKLQQQVDKIAEGVQDFNYKDAINSRLHDELQKYKGGLRKEFIAPLLKGVIREYDRATKMYKYSQKELQNNPNEQCDKLLAPFEMIGEGLLELLNSYDLEPFEVLEGSPFSLNEHRIVEVIETDDSEKDSTVAACLLCGFRDISNNRLERKADVNVYKLKK